MSMNPSPCVQPSVHEHFLHVQIRLALSVLTKVTRKKRYFTHRALTSIHLFYHLSSFLATSLPSYPVLSYIIAILSILSIVPIVSIVSILSIVSIVSIVSILSILSILSNPIILSNIYPIFIAIVLSISSDLIWSIHMSMSTYGRRMIATSQLPPALESREIFLRREPGFEHPNRPKWTDVFVKLCKYIPIFSLIFVHGMIVGMKFEVQFAWDLLRFKMNHPRWNDCHFQVATSRAQPPLCSNALTNTRNLTYFRRKR
jgi:hypothetical protein